MTMCQDVRDLDHRIFHRINIVGKIERMSEYTKKVTTKYGSTVVRQAFLKDKTGVIRLTLWGDDTSRVSNGYTVEIKNGYVNNYYGRKYLTIPRGSGTLRIISANPDSGKNLYKDNFRLYQSKTSSAFQGYPTNTDLEDMGITIDAEQEKDEDGLSVGERAKIEREFWRQSLA